MQTEWKKLGKLSKKTDFRYSREVDPVSSLHKKIRKLSDAEKISDIGVTSVTNKYLREQLIRYLKKHQKYLVNPEYVIEVYMLQYSPVDIVGEEYENFVLYERVSK